MRRALSFASVGLAALLGVATLPGARADDTFSSIPSRFQTADLSVGSRALGEICYSRDVMPDGTVCNPAFLPYNDQSSLLARIFIGNGYSAFNTANQFLLQPVTQGTLQAMFQQNSVTSVEASAGLVFTSRYFSASFTPYRIQYVSEVHNPNDPVMAINASLERELSFSGGIPLSLADPSLGEFSLGSKLSIIQRKYISSTFSFVDVVDNSGQLLPVNNQTAVIYEPSVGWRHLVGGWTLLGSVAGTGIGPATPYDPLWADPADLAVGIGVEPPLPFGRLRIGLDLVNLINGVGLDSRLRAGVSYQFGIFEAMLGANQNAFTSGVYFNASFLDLGLVYEFLRTDLEGDAPENRIATEIAIRL